MRIVHPVQLEILSRNVIGPCGAGWCLEMKSELHLVENIQLDLRVFFFFFILTRSTEQFRDIVCGGPRCCDSVAVTVLPALFAGLLSCGTLC